MRLVGFALLALIGFALVALLVDQSEEVLQAVGLDRNSDRRVEHVLETGSAVLPDSVQGAAGTAGLGIVEHDQWTALAGFSGFQKFSFPLLRQTAITHAVLSIDLTANLELEATGRLKFAVNGTNRGEIVLNEGESRLTVKIPLGPADLALDWVTVAVAVDGQNPKAECTENWSGGVVVAVEPSTQLQVGLDEPVTALIDRIILTGSPTRLIWSYVEPEHGNKAESNVSLPWRWEPFALDAVLVGGEQAEEGDIPVDVVSLVEFRQQALSRQKLRAELDGENESVWPLPFAEMITGHASREFRNKTSWSMNYTRREMPAGQLPDRLLLDLLTVSSDAEAGWLLTVFLNGKLVHSEKIEPKSQKTEREIPLSIEDQDWENTVRISLTSDEKKEGLCVQGRPAAAALEAGTALDRATPASDWTYQPLIDLANSKMDLLIGPSVDAQEANMAMFAISRVFRETRFERGISDLQQHDAKTALAAVVDRDGFDGFLAKSTGTPENTWIIFAVWKNSSRPDIMAFTADDPRFMKAVDLFQPTSAVFIIPPAQ